MLLFRYGKEVLMKAIKFIRSGRILSVILSAVLCVTLLAQNAPGRAEKSVRTVNNIVLFAQFSSDNDYNFMNAERTELVVNGCTQAAGANSLYSYIDAISYGQMQTACYFPQMDGGVIKPYVLSQPLESYTRGSLALEVVRNTDIPEDIPLDGDRDGYIDNFILIIDGEAKSQQDTLWQHMSSVAYANVSINGKKAGSYNMHCSGNLFGSVANPLNLPVLCHEFLHSLGYPDLYRGTGYDDGIPVGPMWDIMAGTLSSALVAPLAYMRASRSGWLETADITGEGTYTLSPALSGSGNRVYLLKTSASDKEFFAVEFRKQGETMRGLDGVCSSGLIVYRVNTTVDGNRDSDIDEIYIFRPENGESTGHANYGGEGRENAIGSLDMSDGIGDGALTYSNGMNSGIRIENIRIEGDSLTFDVRFAEPSRQSIWYSVPNDAGLDTLDIAVSESGIVYLAGAKNSGGSSNSASLYRLSENSCEHISTFPVSGGIYEAQLAVAGETPYLMYRDTDYRAVLCSFDTASGKWQTVWKSDSLAQYTDITAKNGRVYICCSEGDHPAYTLRTICFENGTVSQVGDVIKGGFLQSIVCTDEAVAVAYRDASDNNLPKLAVLENGSWTRITLANEPCSRVSAETDGSEIAVAVTGKSAGIYRYVGKDLTTLGYPELNGEPLNAYPLYVGGKLAAAIYTQKEFGYSLYRFGGSEWEMLGNRIESRAVSEPRVAVSGSTVYTAYQPGDDTVCIRTLQCRGESIPGDVNADGSFNVADLILLQKWLLSVPDTKLADWKAGDLCEDNRLDVFDLCRMRRALLEKKQEVYYYE